MEQDRTKCCKLNFGNKQMTYKNYNARGNFAETKKDYKVKNRSTTK